MIAYLGLTLLALAAAVVWLVLVLTRSGRRVPPEPSPILWICDTCGQLARVRPSIAGVIRLQEIRAAHHCTARADVATEVEAYLAHQPPP